MSPLHSGLSMFEGPDCDWSGQPGSAPTTDQLCRARVARTSQLRARCSEKQMVTLLTFLETFVYLYAKVFHHNGVALLPSFYYYYFYLASNFLETYVYIQKFATTMGWLYFLPFIVITFT
jgi:hypothetical protein